MGPALASELQTAPGLMSGQFVDAQIIGELPTGAPWQISTKTKHSLAPFSNNQYSLV